MVLTAFTHYNMVLYLRLLADLLWEHKIVSLFANLLVIIFLSHAALSNKLLKVQSKIINVIAVIILLLTISLFNDFNEEAFIIYFKVVVSLLVFFYGMSINRPEKTLTGLSSISIYLIIAELIISFFSFGYQYWGDVKTFSGLYFFKTDLALAMVIALSFVLTNLKLKGIIKFSISIVTLYLVLISNARIHLITFCVVVFFILFRYKLDDKFKRKILMSMPVLLTALVIMISTFNLLFGNSLLTIELDPSQIYSASNLQGRNVIWEHLVSNFVEAPFYEQLTGLGLTADKEITSYETGGDLVHNSHNGYLFLLIALGWIGVVIFIIFFHLIFKRFFLIISNYNLKLQEFELMNRVCVLFLVHASIFLITSFTCVTLIFQQQTWFFMFFSGMLFNKRILIQGKMRVVYYQSFLMDVKCKRILFQDR